MLNNFFTFKGLVFNASSFGPIDQNFSMNKWHPVVAFVGLAH